MPGLAIERRIRLPSFVDFWHGIYFHLDRWGDSLSCLSSMFSHFVSDCGVTQKSELIWTDTSSIYLDLLSYLILLFLFFSLLVTMCRTLPQSVSCKVCLPILVELAPSSRKSGIMAWQVALEGVSSIVVASIIGVSWPESQEANELVESLWRCMKKVSGHLFYAPPYVQSWSKRYILTAH